MVYIVIVVILIVAWFLMRASRTAEESLADFEVKASVPVATPAPVVKLAPPVRKTVKKVAKKVSSK